MEALRTELLRLRRAYAASRARDLARRADLIVLVAAVVLAFVSRALVSLPGLGVLEHRFVLLLAVGGGLLLLRPTLRLVARIAAAPPPALLARRLDDTFGWRDEVGTAATIREATGSGGDPTPVESLLLAQSAGRLREVEPTRLWPSSVGGTRLRFVLVLVFLLVLFLPGVGGLLGRGAGGTSPGLVGERPEEPVLAPEDADRWMREHGRLRLRAAAGVEAALALDALFATDAPLPAAWRGRLELLWDREAPLLVEDVVEEEDSTVARETRVDPGRLPALAPWLTPGEHVARVRLTPTEGPWREPLVSNEVHVVVKPPPKGGGSPPPPEPSPQPEPEPPPPTPPRPTLAPEGDEPPPMPPPDPANEVVVTPLVGEGDAREKPEAVVAVRDPEAGTKPPAPVPLRDALADFDRIVERAVAPERFRPSDREFLRRYFDALRAEARRP